ncbi:gastrin/cholecystokinin type B receptor-like [Mya arenaria]|uniref:gastrin/cholecystokinin type B receptor-like n=1 Tax=Mya arenaria TaxID=6604 RepID=UPI0022E6213C|nr:gastrin/cholecystokinin type B receptor-like [Mya arenaria]
MSDNSTHELLQREALAETTIPAWVSIATTVVLTLVFIMCISGNSLVGAVQLRQPRRSSTDYFVLTMAAFDFLTGLTLIPWMVFSLHLPLRLMVASDAICKVYQYFRYAVNIASTVLLSAIALDRYFKVCRPHSNALSPIKARRTCLVLSAGVLIGCAPITFNEKLNMDTMLCGRVSALGLVFDTILLLTFVGLFAVTSVSYFLVAKALRKRRRIRTENAVSYHTSKRTSSDQTVAIREPIVAISGDQIDATLTKHSIVTISQSRTNNEDSVQGNTHNKPNFKTNKESGTIDPMPIPHTTAYGPSHCSQGVQSNAFKAYRQTPLTTQTPPKSDRRLTRVTFAMFLITVVYIASWIITLMAMGLVQAQSWSEHSLILQQTLLKTYIVNCATNPLFYIWISSTFRSRVRETLTCYRQ